MCADAARSRMFLFFWGVLFFAATAEKIDVDLSKTSPARHRMFHPLLARASLADNTVVRIPHGILAKEDAYGAIEPAGRLKTQYDSLLSSWRCTPNKETCLFHNLYVLDDEHVYVAVLKSELPLPLSNYRLALNGNNIDPPKILSFDTMEDAKAKLVVPKSRVRQNLTLWASGPFHGNWAHCFFDGIYPSFVGLVELGLHMVPFNLLWRQKGDGAWTEMEVRRWAEVNGGTLEFFHHNPPKENFINYPITSETTAGEKYFKFLNIVYGSYRKQERHLQRNLALAGARPPLNALYHFTRRFYTAYGLNLPVKRTNANNVFNIAFIDNKRFSQTHKIGFKQLASKLATIAGLKNSAGDDLIINAEYYDLSALVPTLSRVPGIQHDKTNNSKAQLVLMSDLDLYITAPGTGMFMHPFMPEGSFVINTGYCRPLQGKKGYYGFPLYADQFISEGTAYMKALYYPSSKLCAPQPANFMLRHDMQTSTFDMSVFEDLVMQAIRMRGFSIPVEPFGNLSPEARIFNEFLSRLQDTPAQHPDAFAWPYWPTKPTMADEVLQSVNTEDQFLEFYVYEHFRFRAKDIPVNATHVDNDYYRGATDIPLLRQIKAKYRSELQDMQVFPYEGHTTGVLTDAV